MLGGSIQLSGEDQFYFIERRLRDLVTRLPNGFSPRRILDFGCGIGATSSYLSQLFPLAEILGMDTAAQAIQYAVAQRGAAASRHGTGWSNKDLSTSHIETLRSRCHHSLSEVTRLRDGQASNKCFPSIPVLFPEAARGPSSRRTVTG
jgi:SAM-dependent methyltransferase